MLKSDAFKPRSDRHGTEYLDEQELQMNVKHSMKEVRSSIRNAIKKNSAQLLNRILSAYTDQRPFSPELVGASSDKALKKMYDLGWTRSGFFDSAADEQVLHQAIARYHGYAVSTLILMNHLTKCDDRFLGLMASSPVTFLVPTLDIDLVWHSHQMLGRQYHEDCKKYITNYLRSDDKVEESKLANAFELTCRAWQARYDVPYMHCGCPVPGKRIGEKLAHLKHKFLGARAAGVPRPRADAEREGVHASERP
ncbi:hypothetical protein EWM64_g7777 [Hericium alpestre]|uniref:Uncharacterized protein n=1 Tax=Hericium alpestre TaxID=135208 RepID=A0A4Y9ZNP7_9AGAM|nr:hypothetical protein EWM64_g7777 [Hericium alpestre]